MKLFLWLRILETSQLGPKVINHPDWEWFNGNHTTYLWWWLGDGLIIVLTTLHRSMDSTLPSSKCGIIWGLSPTEAPPSDGSTYNSWMVYRKPSLRSSINIFPFLLEMMMEGDVWYMNSTSETKNVRHRHPPKDRQVIKSKSLLFFSK